MVDITKLRIGNYIYKYAYGVSDVPVGKALFRITLEMFNDIANRPFDYEYAKIDEDFLLKRGFERYKITTRNPERCSVSEKEGYKKGVIIFDYKFNLFEEYDGAITELAYLDYIHEFQNYHLLCFGEELN